jgi:hypothetical protein
MILSAHQPAYLPWLGYFEKIRSADVFVYLDTVQFEKNSFTNRNKIKTPQGELWLTIPVKAKGHLSGTLQTLEIDPLGNWKKKHLGSIHANYKKAKRFDALYPKLEALYAREHALLSELCFDHLFFWLSEIGLERKIVKSSTLGIASANSDLVLDLCKSFGATGYVSGALGRDYLKEGDFRAAGIQIAYQDYKHPVYPQLWGGEFLPYMSILDFLMNTDDVNLIWGA